ncbi:sulfite exporter TauE/SafE family protein [Bauldia sp.]|uniref:sulfite exporter TauE/SafE family protein n=1 Tax=Bauldia sp. TaxID=2575872 RepID=UPI003BAD68EC
MIDNPWFYAAAVPAMLILGLSKGGFSVLGLLTVPILSIAISPVQAAGITLPILLLSDMVALYSYWRQWSWRMLAALLPGALVGITVGWLTAAWVSEGQIRLIVGAVSVAFALNHWLRRRDAPPARPTAARGLFWGTVAGFTSFVSHAGGPPYQVYAAPLRLQPRIFAATSVVFFAIVNGVKVVPYFFLGQFNPANLMTSAVLLPLSIPATILGVWIVKRIDPKIFYEWIYVLVFVVGAFLVVQSLLGMV